MIRVRNVDVSSSVGGYYRVSFDTSDIDELGQVLKKHNKKQLVAEFKELQSARSRNANSYMWVLCKKIADVIHSTKDEVYKHAVREVGVFADVAVQRSALKKYIEYWTGQGIGYQVDVFDSGLADNKGDPMKRVRCYLGSSKYTKEQMSVLIDYIVEQAKELEIQTETPEVIARMKALWGEENGSL